jgi:hypothetical protein
MLQGIGEMSLRALNSVLPPAAKLALSKKLKHHEVSMIQECLQQSKGPKKGKVFHLCRTHWVSICPSFILTMPIAGVLLILTKLVKFLPNYRPAHIPLIH